MFRGWDKDFTLVQWDQRGAGRTFGRNGPANEGPMTIESMEKDGVEVAEYLIEHLQKDRIIIVGGSWGSILGIEMAHQQPDLFFAYVGMAQVVNWQAGLAASYSRVLDLARASGDRPAVEALTGLGPPPWDRLSEWGAFRKWERFYQTKVTTAQSAPETINPEYDSPQERAQAEAADDFSFGHFMGLTLSGPLTKVDLPALGTSFAIPIFMIQGQEDLTAPPRLAKAYFETLRAPHKRFYLARGTGHAPSAIELDLVHDVLVREVRPLALGH
jgi:pimeloyl-ACP methyl ester carboxylesterase